MTSFARQQRGAIKTAILRAGRYGQPFTIADVQGDFDHHSLRSNLSQLKRQGILEVVHPCVMGRYGKPSVYRVATP